MANKTQPSLYDMTVVTIDGKPVSLATYRGQTLLIVNVASKCGFTKQYTELEDMYRRFHQQGFTILGFPCNQFAKQEPGSEAEIKNFCQTNYQVSFPLFAKIAVNGPDSHPLYQFLKREAKGFLGTQRIKWNFTKFLVNRQGKILKRYAPYTTPAQIEHDLSQLLAEQTQL